MGYLTDAFRVMIICVAGGSAALHIAVLTVPNWWYFDYATWVQDTSGVVRLNGGLFQVCQFDRPPIANIEYSIQGICAPYFEGPGGLKDTSDGLHQPTFLQPLTQGLTIAAILPSLPVVLLCAVSFRLVVNPQRKRQFMALTFACLVIQTLLMVSGVSVAHEWIIQASCQDCEWRDLYDYEWCFYAACGLIGVYTLNAFLALMGFLLEKPPKVTYMSDDAEAPPEYKATADNAF